MNATKEDKKKCLTCRYFQSFFEMYDAVDDEEPKDQGRCRHKKAYDESEDAKKKEEIAGQYGRGCKDWKQIKKK